MAKQIPIDQRLPFDFCSDCDKFEPMLDVQKSYGTNRKILRRKVVLECRNDWLCRQLKDNIDDLIGGDPN